MQNCALQYSALLEKVETPRYVVFADVFDFAFIMFLEDAADEMNTDTCGKI